MSGHLKQYRGTPRPNGQFVVTVVANGKVCGDLEANTRLWNFGSSGFSWGMDPQGGNQLSLTLLSRVVGDDKAVALCEAFRAAFFDFVPPYEPWRICENSIAAIAQSCEYRLAGRGR